MPQGQHKSKMKDLHDRTYEPDIHKTHQGATGSTDGHGEKSTERIIDLLGSNRNG